ncbi:HNH endonuclease [Agromyces atrinae]|uniref:HNH endonuclease signature motif containing protein n=1 Tax=Agromyces atrinae TaxID=592376 RepID=UPI001F5A7A5B|nr:HNH endonuclease signature motif containing protein [Agromyces atrinae]MCI2959528.1 HNH endonuclease [Agromyces atrinae]
MIAPKVPKPTAADERDAYELVTLRDDNTCQRCRRGCGPIARDHRQNRQSGNTVVSNLQCLGLECHIWKTEHPRDALREGFAVPRYAVPSEWPARRWVRTDLGTLRRAWVLYGDAGEIAEISETEAYDRMEGRAP